VTATGETRAAHPGGWAALRMPAGPPQPPAALDYVSVGHGIAARHGGPSATPPFSFVFATKTRGSRCVTAQIYVTLRDGWMVPGGPKMAV